jgi:hopanoid biosynthesis associated RND transporter like protein HpnN
MLKQPIIFTVDWCWRHAKLTAFLFLLLCGGLGYVAISRINLDTDQSHLISSTVPFRLAEQAMDAAFPQNMSLLVVVLDADTSPHAEEAVDKLEAALKRTDLFRSVRRPPEELLFRKHGLLFLPVEELTELSDRLTAAQPLIGTLAQDPSLRGFLSAVGLGLQGIEAGQAAQDSLQPLLDQLDRPAAQIAGGNKAETVQWTTLVGGLAEHDRPQRILLTQPLLQYDSLVAGEGATAAIRAAAARLGPDVKVRVTGPVALSDANFASITQGTAINAPLMLLAVVLLIYFAVKSIRIVFSIMLALIAGLLITMFFGVVAVGDFNPISIAFGVMFVGIAVDFAIQFVVRYRYEQQRNADPREAMRSAARESAAPLSLAAIATAVGFLSFVPTEYTGVSQLGLIAGGGMIIALVIDFTLLPALLALLPPKRIDQPMGLPWAGADNLLAKYGRPVVTGFIFFTLVGLALLPSLPLDFNPLHLQSSKSEPVATFEELAKDSDNGVFAVDLLAEPDKVAAIEKHCDEHPEVLRCLSLDDFTPAQQDDKLAILKDLSDLLSPTMNPPQIAPAPNAAQLRDSLRKIADKLGDNPTAAHLRAVADKDDSAVLALQSAVVGELPNLLKQLKDMLATSPVGPSDLSPQLVADWKAADGRWRLQIAPKDDMNLSDRRIAFDKAVEALAGDVPAAGAPISIEQSGHVVVHAFVQAGLSAVAAIFVLLWLLLRKVRDAALVMLPLVIGALLTVISCVVSGLAINYANIIALPLLLGIGVAFNIYFVINWRYGLTTPLQSPTTRAVLFSALTTGCAFGSLAASPHVGTASMGLLLFLSLGLSVATTFLLLPAIFAVMKK